MTPQLNLQLGDPNPAGNHLTNDQMSELLVARMVATSDLAAFEAVEAHLAICPACEAELASLRDALGLFQEANVACADREFGRLRMLDRPAYPVPSAYRPFSPALFWVAASAVLLAGILPLEMHWQRTSPAPVVIATSASDHAPESDEALLEDINQDLSRSVPASMQALDEPTGASASTTSIQADTQTSTQRKD